MIHPIQMLGIGPGDPELVTMKAVRLIKEADTIYVPESDAGGRSVADRIISPYADKEKIRLSYFPMTNDEAELDKRYTALAKEIANEQSAGKRVVYVTLGDSMLFSTAQYVTVRLRRLGITPTFIPGITSYVASANLAGISLADKHENVLVTGIPDNTEAIKQLCDTHDTVVLMKIHKYLNVLLEYVQKHNPAVAMLTQRVGLDGECIIDLTANKDIPKDAGYLSICIIKKSIK